MLYRCIIPFFATFFNSELVFWYILKGVAVIWQHLFKTYFSIKLFFSGLLMLEQIIHRMRNLFLKIGTLYIENKNRGDIMDDAKIIDLFFSRDESAIKETERKYGGLCYTVANNILNSRTDSEECVNDTYMGLWNAIPPERPASLKSYILKITRNLAVKRLRYQTAGKRTRELEVSLSELEDILPGDGIPEDFDMKTLTSLLNSFLRGITPEARNMFIRKYWFCDSIERIAEMYGASESKVKSSLFRTREKLKKYLSEKGVQI